MSPYLPVVEEKERKTPKATSLEQLYLLSPDIKRKVNPSWIDNLGADFLQDSACPAVFYIVCFLKASMDLWWWPRMTFCSCFQLTWLCPIHLQWGRSLVQHPRCFWLGDQRATLPHPHPNIPHIAGLSGTQGQPHGKLLTVIQQGLGGVRAPSLVQGNLISIKDFTNPSHVPILF